MRTLSFILPNLLLLSACSLENSDVKIASMPLDTNQEVVNMNQGVTPQDTVSPVVHDVTSGMTDDKLQIDAEVIDSIPQLSFCDCIQKTKELDEEFNATEDDQELMLIVKKHEELTQGECAKLLRNTFETKVDEENYQQRITNCLNNK